MLVLRGPSAVPVPGAIQFAGGPIAWIADNFQKGISAVPAVTIHARGDWSREHFEDASEAVMAMLAAAAEPWLGGRLEDVVAERSLHRWKFALPTHPVRSPLLAVSDEPPIVCCGDAFGGGRVEAAASSGLAAGRWLSRVLAG
jgi:renalase